MGADQLSGGAGADLFRCGTPLETLNGSAVADTITDFSLTDLDRIDLSAQVFTALSGAPGVLNASALLASTADVATTAVAAKGIGASVLGVPHWAEFP